MMHDNLDPTTGAERHTTKQQDQATGDREVLRLARSLRIALGDP